LTYFAIYFKENLEEKIGFTESAAGIGFALGPIIGGYIYDIYGY
jgi:hypothetical protein